VNDWRFFLIIVMLSGFLVGCMVGMHTTERYYTVKYGDSLYTVAWRYGLDYKKVARWNGISAPYTIYPGQKLYLNPRVKSSSVAQKQGKKKHTAVSVKKVKPSPRTSKSKLSVNKPITKPDNISEQINKSVEWLWPVDGNVVKSFSAKARGKKGIDIAGALGQSIKAASSGKVVYSGSGLTGYGQLIIIKHNNKYLSAYAHNSKLFVSEGEKVKSGQKIAELGSTGTDRPKLYFEIRQNGNPVDPLRYLPKRR
jgi:lipoprotein NlpD